MATRSSRCCAEPPGPSVPYGTLAPRPDFRGQLRRDRIRAHDAREHVRAARPLARLGILERVDPIEPEAAVPAFGPLEVIHERPVEVPDHSLGLAPQRGERLDE